MSTALGARLKLLSKNKRGTPKSLGHVLASLRWLVRNETGRERVAKVAKVLEAAAGGTSVRDFEAALKMDAYRSRLRSKQ